MAQQPIDLRSLAHSTLPDLTLIPQPKLTLDLGTPDLEASIHQHLSQEQPLSHQLPSTPAPEQPLHQQQLDRNRSRRWTSLSELGRAVLRPSLSRSHLKLGSLSERTTHSSYAGRIPPSRRMSDSTHTLIPTPSIYSTCRHHKHLFKLWSHAEPPIQGSPTHTPVGNTFPSLPPMSELLGDSSMLQFDQQDLSSITEPINTYQDHNVPPTKPTPSILSAPVPVVVSQPAPPPSSPSSPSLASSSSSSSSSSPSSLAANNPAAFSSAVQSPDAAAIPLPKTPSLRSCASSSVPVGAVPTIERVLSKAEQGEEEEDKLAVSSKVADSPPAEDAVVGDTGGHRKELSEGPVAGESSVAAAAAAVATVAATAGQEEDTTAKTQEPSSMTHTRTHLTGLLSRKKKPHPTAAASSGSGTPSFFKLFLLKGLGLKSSPSPAS